MSRHHAWVLLICAALPCAGRAEVEWAATRASFICRSSSEVREIKTYVPEAGAAGGRGCRVDYVKGGSTRTLWSSGTSRAYCDGKAAMLAARISRGGFSCAALHAQ